MKSSWVLTLGVMAVMAMASRANALTVTMTVDSITTSAGSCTLTLTNKVTLSDIASVWDTQQLMVDGTAVMTWKRSASGGGIFSDQEVVILTATGMAKTYPIGFHDEGIVSGGPTRWTANTNTTTVTVNP